MDASRKPLAKIEGRRRMRLSGVTVAWRGPPNLDDWVAYIINGTRSKKLILSLDLPFRRVVGQDQLHHQRYPIEEADPGRPRVGTEGQGTPDATADHVPEGHREARQGL